eukprot:TRINITY_DN51974_c0_g1_i1.p1 TRINITY_DN51974_c0_g1~~TRINITY_DN51974_c0_g1_i1.p1  ORF type:complete len:104 (-),score=30.51 TRINITY_DN51974_c0_g1_i1:40-351(-)
MCIRDRYKQQVEDRRRLVKSEYVHVKRQVSVMREAVLTDYEKLWDLVDKRAERDQERQRAITEDKLLAEAREKEVQYKKVLVAQIETVSYTHLTLPTKRIVKI